ncbi:hypothetical protein ANSO36C_48480 [Nostoc cf. commune SO-36]|uniref:Uncharacterized protein n=1 Tax=Nostoc cf. commune SO-36 TaxID=449208 RepID=A0ABN6Q9V1_NOSCO|nr:hypothetical protein [Nostoc commune]BDI19046.1 hypothetical protein ANSO36C_48480 [Nostoc cf. commune SO-36]
MKNLPDLLLRLFFGAALVVIGINIQRYGSGGSFVICKATPSKTASCTVTERFAFSQQIIEEKTIDNVTQGKVAIINAIRSDLDGNSEDIQFFRVLLVTKKGISYKIGQDGKDPTEAKAVAANINFLIENPNASPIQLDYSSNITNFLGWGLIGLGVTVSLFMRTEK